MAKKESISVFGHLLRVVVPQSAAQFGSRAGKTALDRPTRDAEDFADLRIVEILEVTQENDLAVLFRQERESGAKLFSRLTAVRGGVWRV